MTIAPEIIEGEIVSESREVAIRPSVTLVPNTTAQDLVKRLDVIRGAMEQAMQRDIDYGVIPGTGKKPTLLKPGAEKLAVLFQLDVQLDNQKTWHDDGHLTVVSRATVFHIPSGARVASGEGICTTREGKYAYRQGERVCPSCSQPAIIKGKAEYGGGWVCFKKKGGCNAKYQDGDQAIEGQAVGKIANENIADTYNTVDKMASKRARVDAVLAATGASALFTQDAEDLPKAAPDPVSASEWDGSFPPPDDVTVPPVKTITQAQVKRLFAVANSHSVSDTRLREIVKEHAGVESTKEIPAVVYDALVAAVELEAPEESGFAARAAEAQATRDASEAQV